VATRVDGSLYYVHSDHLGSTVAVSDADGVAVGRVQYDPYGEVLTSTLPADLTDRLFTGVRFDGTIGLYQMGARWYDPALGRWMQADTIVPEPGNPQDLNRYTYVRNNPLRYTDPSGHWIFEGGPGDPYFIGPWLYEAQRRQDFITSHAPTTGEFVAVVTSPFWAAGLALGFETMAIGLWEAGGIAYETVLWWATEKWIEAGLRGGEAAAADEAAARELMEEAATARGLDPGELEGLISEIRLVEGSGWRRFFRPFRITQIGDKWVADITTPHPTVGLPSNIFELRRGSQLRIAVHELEHALQWRATYELAGGNMEKALELFLKPGLGSVPYAVREILTEATTLATLQEYLGKVPAAVWTESMNYIDSWMKYLD
jgi:RHS repeat-associated protein